MDKQQAADKEYPLFCALYIRREREKEHEAFKRGWEAHEAQQAAAQTILCPECKGDGFIPTAGKQVDGTYQVDCEICESTGKIAYPSAATQQSPIDAVAHAKAFVEWTARQRQHNGLKSHDNYGWYYETPNAHNPATYDHKLIGDTDDLYAEFNPSGA